MFRPTALLGVSLALLATPALAQTFNTRTNTESSAGAMAVVAPVTNYYNSGKIKQRIETTASAFAPALTAAGVHSCAGSASVGVAATGFNFGIGSTYEMQECNRRAYAATLAGMGQNAAALALVCNNPEVMQALNLTGVVCPQQQVAARAMRIGAPMQARAAYASASAAVPATTDAYVDHQGRPLSINGVKQVYAPAR